jgi:hypothetical protein
MATPTISDVPPQELKDRIKELNEKATQMLLFLSFALVGAATVKQTPLRVDDTLVRSAMQWWMWAVVLVLFVVLPLKELADLFGWDRKRWYTGLKWGKAIVLAIAVVVSLLGVKAFLRALYDP